jgi:hypothetical protein
MTCSNFSNGSHEDSLSVILQLEKNYGGTMLDPSAGYHFISDNATIDGIEFTKLLINNTTVVTLTDSLTTTQLLC